MQRAAVRASAHHATAAVPRTSILSDLITSEGGRGGPRVKGGQTGGPCLPACLPVLDQSVLVRR